MVSMSVRLAKMGDCLKIHYLCYDCTGQLLESTHDGEPPQITLGEKQILPALEEALVGLAAGQSRTVVLPPARAFGDYQEDLVGFVPYSQLQLEGEEPQVGLLVTIEDDSDDEPMLAEITALEEKGVIVDSNHPLAGQTLKFELTLVAFSA